MQNFTLSIIIPCCNEKDNIKNIVTKVLAAPIANKEIIVVDDCSTDGTKEIIKKEIEPLVSRVIYHRKNTGKGGAIRSGFAAATGGILIVQDHRANCQWRIQCLLWFKIFGSKSQGLQNQSISQQILNLFVKPCQSHKTH